MNGCNCPHCNGCRPVPKEMLRARLRALKAQDKRIEKNIEKMIAEETVLLVIANMDVKKSADLVSVLYLRKKGVFD